MRYLLHKYVQPVRRDHPDFTQPVSPHSLRHMKGMHLLQSGVPLEIIRDFLGHVDVKTNLYMSLKARGMSMLDRPEGAGLHQILLLIGTSRDATRAMRDLEVCHILTGTQRIPDQRLNSDSGLRFGTQLIARKRYDAAALDVVANLVFDVLTAGPSERVLKQSVDLARTFSSLYYCFDMEVSGNCESISHNSER